MADPPTNPVAEMARDCVAARLRLLNRLVTKLYDDALRPHGLRVSQMNILVMVAEFGPSRGVDLAKLLRLDASTLSRDLERMIERGWAGASAGVGRARVLEATEAGRTLLRAVAPAWRKAQEQAKELLSPDLAADIAAAAKSVWATASAS